MTVQCRPVSFSEKEILNHLLEKYNYEFSQYDKIPLPDNGLYGYPYLDYYWTEPGRFAYFILVDGNLAGFALIHKRPECDRKTDWSVAEFFVIYPYRNLGVATEVMDQIFAVHKGTWQIKYHSANIASVKFWNKIAGKYAKNGYDMLVGSEDYFDGTKSAVLVFEV